MVRLPLPVCVLHVSTHPPIIHPAQLVSVRIADASHHTSYRPARDLRRMSFFVFGMRVLICSVTIVCDQLPS